MPSPTSLVALACLLFGAVVMSAPITNGPFTNKRGDAYYYDSPSYRPPWEGYASDGVIMGNFVEYSSVGGYRPYCKGCLPNNDGDQVNQTYVNLIAMNQDLGGCHRDIMDNPVQAADKYRDAAVPNDALIYRQRAAQNQEDIYGRCPFFPIEENCTQPDRSFAISEVQGGFLLQPNAFMGNRGSCVHKPAEAKTCVKHTHLTPNPPTQAARDGFFAGVDTQPPYPTTLFYNAEGEMCYRPGGETRNGEDRDPRDNDRDGDDDDDDNDRDRGNRRLICGKVVYDSCRRGFIPVLNITKYNNVSAPTDGFGMYRGVAYPCVDFVRNNLYTPNNASQWTWCRVSSDYPEVVINATWDHLLNGNRIMGFSVNDIVRLNVFNRLPTRDHALNVARAASLWPAGKWPVLVFENIYLVNNDSNELTMKEFQLPHVYSSASPLDPLTPTKIEGWSNARRVGYLASTSLFGGHTCANRTCTLAATPQARVERIFAVALQAFRSVNVLSKESISKFIVVHKKGMYDVFDPILNALVAREFPNPLTRPGRLIVGHEQVYPIYTQVNGYNIQGDNDIAIAFVAYEERTAI